MRRIYKYYKRTYGNDKNTLYLFFINHPNPDKAGFMPVAGDYGFIFNFGKDYRTNYDILAHELAHGAFNLRHPFSPKSTYQLPRGSTDNLMDYGKPAQGTGLWKYQWDLIHNPEFVLLAHAEEEEEGALKGKNDYDKVINVIEMLRCGYNSDRKVQFQKDVFSWFNESATVRDFDGLYDNITYGYIYVQLNDDDELIKYPSDLELEEPDNILNSLLNLTRGEVLKLDFGGLFILVDKGNAEYLLNYLTPSKQEYELQQRQFVTSIKDLYDSKQYTRQRVLKILRTSSQCLYESLTKDQRISLLGFINDGSNIPEVAEKIVIDIIRTTPEEQIRLFLEDFSKTGLLAEYNEIMNDFGGDDNYTQFIFELLKLYLKEFSDDLDCFFSNNSMGPALCR